MLSNSTFKNLNILNEYCEMHIKRTQQEIIQIQLRNHYNVSPPLYVVLPITFWIQNNKEFKLIKLITTNLLNAHNDFNKSFVLTLKDRLQTSMVDNMIEHEQLSKMNLIKFQKYLDYTEFTKNVIALIDDALHEIEEEDEEEECDIRIEIRAELSPQEIEELINTARRQLLGRNHSTEQVNDFEIRLRQDILRQRLQQQQQSSSAEESEEDEEEEEEDQHEEAEN